MAKDWKNLSDRVVKLVGLRTKPLGFKFFKSADELKGIEGIARPAFKRTVCQFIGSARYLGQAWGATAEDQFCQAGAWTLGVFPDTPEAFATGELYTDTVLGIATPEAARRIADGLPKNKDKFEAFAVMPLDGGAVAEQITFEPDLVIIYGEPGQLGLLTMTTCAALGIPAFRGRILGDTGICADGIPACWNSGECTFFLPCIGDRAYGGALTSEVAIVFPADKFNDAVVSNMEKLSFPLNWTLSAPLGAYTAAIQLMTLMGASTYPLTKGTPLIPEKES